MGTNDQHVHYPIQKITLLIQINLFQYYTLVKLIQKIAITGDYSKQSWTQNWKMNQDTKFIV